MKKRCKTSIVDLLGAIAFIIVLVGLFTDFYDFVHGLLIAIIIVILTGVIKKYWRVDQNKKK